MSKPIILPFTKEPHTACSAFPGQTSVTRPLVLTNLEYNGQVLPFAFTSVIDSGADTCVFPAELGEKLGIPVRKGKTQDTKGIGTDVAFYHEVRVLVELDGQIYPFDCWAGFMYSLDAVGKGLLGRRNFFDLFESVTFKKDFVELQPKVASIAISATVARNA